MATENRVQFNLRIEPGTLDRIEKVINKFPMYVSINEFMRQCIREHLEEIETGAVQQSFFKLIKNKEDANG